MSLALRDEHRLRVFGNRVMREVFGPVKEEVIQDWRLCHSEEFHELFVCLNKEDKMDGKCDTCWGEEKCIQIFGGEI